MIAVAETIHLRGEGGAVFTMDLPLHETVAARLKAGQLHRVNPDGSPYRKLAVAEQVGDGQDGQVPPPPSGAAAGDPAAAGAVLADDPAPPAPPVTGVQVPPPPVPGAQAPELPARNAATGTWRTWAIQHGGLTQEEAGQLSRDELIELLAPADQPAG